jgi:putative flippase GtrA
MKWRHWIHLPWRSLSRWWVVGIAFYLGGLGVLFFFREVLGMPLIFGTLLAAESTTLLRFFINDRWVFGHRRPTWLRLWQYHAAGAAGFAVWWTAANILPPFGIHYLLASTIGTGCSVFFSMLTNFFWIWRRRSDPVPAAPAALCPRGEEAGIVE